MGKWAVGEYDRVPQEKYYTPEWVVRALLEIESFPGERVWEPAAGAGNLGGPIIDLMKPEFLYMSDLDPDADVPGCMDFLDPYGGLSWDTIITNPPYGSQGRTATAFIKKGLAVTRGRAGKVAMLLRSDFDSARTRRSLFGEHPAFDKKYTLLDRIRWTNLPQSDSGPRENHAWFVWDWARKGGSPIELCYLSKS